MSHLLVVARPSLIPGFQLAGVEAFAAENAAQARRLIEDWLEKGETGLLAGDGGLLRSFDSTFLRGLEAAEGLPHLAFPSGEPVGPETSSRRQIAELIRRAIGFHVTFRG